MQIHSLKVIIKSYMGVSRLESLTLRVSQVAKGLQYQYCQGVIDYFKHFINCECIFGNPVQNCETLDENNVILSIL